MTCDEHHLEARSCTVRPPKGITTGITSKTNKKASPIDLQPTQDYAIGSKEAALAAVLKANLQARHDDAEKLFRESGCFSGELECTEVSRLPGEITLRCSIKSVRDIVSAANYPGMMVAI